MFKHFPAAIFNLFIVNRVFVRFLKTVSASLFLLLICAVVSPISAQVHSEIAMPPNGDNQRAEVSQWIGLVKITIAYHSPNLHGGGGVDRSGRIFGQFLPYGMFDEGFGPSRSTPWRAGANESTTITFSHDVKIEGKDLKAGTYALFLELQKDAPWIWIFSKDAVGWGSYQYEEKSDALRVQINPQDAPHTEFLTYGFDDRKPDSVLAYLQWDNKRIPFKIEVPNITQLYVDQMRKDLLSWPGFNYQNWQSAAQFCAANKINLDEALIWADKAIHEPFKNAAQGRADFSTYLTKASVLTAMGKEKDADATMDEAIKMPGTQAFQIHQYGMRLLQAGRKEKAMDVFKTNQQLHPEEKFYTYLGLARGYTAIGDKKNAISNWEIALQNVPPAQRRNTPVFENALKALKESK